MRSRRRTPDLLAISFILLLITQPPHQSPAASDHLWGLQEGGWSLTIRTFPLDSYSVFGTGRIRINFFSPLWIKSVKYSLHFSLLVFYLSVIWWRDLAAHSLCCPGGCTLPWCLRRHSNDPPSPTTCCGCCFRSGLV